MEFRRVLFRSDKVKIPMLASGGIGDARGLVAALALGAEGINMGTRFCATQEAPIHDNIKQLYVGNDERGTNLIFRKFKNTARVGKNTVSARVVEISACADAMYTDIKHYFDGDRHGGVDGKGVGVRENIRGCA